MASNKHTPTVSVGRELYRRLDTYCADNGIGKSALVEFLVANPDATAGDLEGISMRFIGGTIAASGA